jgi:hypothetical protein
MEWRHSTIDMAALAKGGYFIKLMLTNGNYTVQKLVKE